MKIIQPAIVAALLFAGGAASATNLVINGGFEHPRSTFTGKAQATPLGFGAHTYLSAAFGWQSVACSCLTEIIGKNNSSAGRFDSYPSFPSPVGGNYLRSDADPEENANGYVYQTLTGLTAEMTYNVSFYQAGASYYANIAGNQAQWRVGFGGTLEGDYRNELTNATTALSAMMDLNTSTGSPWQKQKLSFVATGTSALLSFLATGGPSGQPPFALLDGVSVTAAPLVGSGSGSTVPEAATWMMMIAGFGLAGLANRRRSASVTA